MYTCILGHEVVSRWERGGVQPYHLPVVCMKALCSRKVSRGSQSLWRKSLTTPQSTFMSQFQGCLLHKDAPSLILMFLSTVLITDSLITIPTHSSEKMIKDAMQVYGSWEFNYFLLFVMLCTYPGTLYMPIWVNPLLDLSDTVDDECRQTANSGGREGC